MNNTNPIIPPGSVLEQKNKSRARVKVAVFFVLAIHGIGLMALLMQGCHKEEPTTASNTDTSTAAPPAFTATTNPPAVPETAATTSTPTAPPTSTLPAATETPAAVSGAASDYTVAKGDNFWTIGKKFNVSSKAIADANPGVDAAKLKIGQKLHIPAAEVKTAAAAVTTASATSTSGSEQTYTVKSGDSLIKLASQFGTTVKAIQSANSMSTSRIVVGQKLKIPGKSTASTSAASAATTALPETASTNPAR